MGFINDLMSLVYPRHCEACEGALFRHETYICNLCRTTLPRSRFHLDAGNPLATKFYGRVPFHRASSFLLFEKSGKVQRMLHAIKYQGQKELAFHLGKLYAGELSDSDCFSGVDAVVPVPLHARKLKQRGFNQSEWFAMGLAEGLGKPLDATSLVRVRDTGTQTRKRRYERWENVEGIFELKQPDAFNGRHVLVADDVITTGATLEATWLALKAAEGVKVSLCSIAFATGVA